MVILTSLYLLTYVGPITAADELGNCSKSESDCIPGVSWFDSKTCSCHNCSKCVKGGKEMYVKQQCNVSRDAVCECHEPLYFDIYEDRCVIDCHLCKSRECGKAGTESCLCPNPECYQEHDLYCREGPILCQKQTTETSTQIVMIHQGETSLPPWGIGLIAVGVVIGIIIFASCFLCLGIVTVTKNNDPESQGSESSENGFVMRGSISSVGTKTSYVSSSGYPYLNNHNMLELLKNSNPQFLLPTGINGSCKVVGDGVSSLTSSPVSVRGSPRPVRTIKLVKNSNKVSAVGL